MQATPVYVTARGRQTLEDLAGGLEGSDALSTRARIVLLAVEGRRNVQIAAELGVSIANVANWRNRYTQQGIAGLHDRPRSGRPRKVDRAVIIAESLQTPPSGLGLTRWTCRELGRHVGVAEATVARTWREYGLAPRDGGALAFTTQPSFSAAVVEIVGLHGGAGVRAAALLLEPAAPERTSPVSTVDDEPREAGLARATVGRDGTAHHGPTGPGADLVRFVRVVVDRYPNRGLELVLDSAAVVRQLRAGNVLASHPHLHLRFTLDPDSWLNLAEVWVQIMGRHGIDSQPAAQRELDLLRAGSDVAWITPPPGSVTRTSGQTR